MHIKTIQTIVADAMKHFNAAALCHAILVTIHWKRRVSEALLASDAMFRFYGDAPILGAVISDKKSSFLILG